MNNIERVGEKCCGCHGCEQNCPVGAITFSQTDEGFLYPVISDGCIGCGECVKHCPVENIPMMTKPKVGYAAYLKEREKLRRSSSGGVFVAVAEVIITRGGAVFGCAEIDPGMPVHVVVTVNEDLANLQGSKYAQSDMSGIYAQVKQELERDIPVLFSGTPCQVAGLLKLTGKRDNLFTVDVICHGVPSRKMYKEYLLWLEQKNNATVKSFHFRSKEKHDWSLTYRVSMEKAGKPIVQERIASLSPYYSHFLKGMDYRESCYICPFACGERVSDLTLGDFWGVERVLPDFNNADGVSAVLVNSERGQELWKWIQTKISAKEVSVQQIINNNGQLQHPTERPTERNSIYSVLNEGGYEAVIKEYSNRKEIILDSLKDMLPNRIRQKIKRIFSR